MSYTLIEKAQDRLKEKGWTITQLAEKANISRPQASLIINGLRKSPINQVKVLLQALSFSTEEIDKMVDDYKKFYEIANNNRDFKNMLLIRRFGLDVYEIQESENIKLTMGYKNQVYLVEINLPRGLVGYMKQDDKEFTSLKNAEMFCNELGINPSSFLDMLRFFCIDEVKRKEADELRNEVTIGKGWLKKTPIKWMKDYMNNKDVGLIQSGDESGGCIEVEEDPYNICLTEIMEDCLSEFLEMVAGKNIKEIEVLPGVFKILEKDITPYL